MQVNFSVLFQRFRCALILMILLLGLVVIIGCSSGGGNAPGVARNTVATEFGSLSGYAASGAWIYKGIPYAAPPVGNLRWRAPQDPDSWTGVRDATRPASVCTQEIYSRQWVPATVTSVSSPSSYTGSEDCLYLDIYRPQTNDTDLPVFVWIHGGANNFGGATSYDGTTLAVRENMIVVVVQYRLAALGWLFHTALGDGESTSDASGNYGTLDHIQALTWVQNNIAAFGGDPAQVTVGGQSAGGHAVIDLITSPLTAGLDLFSKGVALSPAMALLPPNDTLTDYMIDWLLLDDNSVTPAGTPPHYNSVDWTNADTYRSGMSTDLIKTYLRGKSAVKIMEACIEANFHMTGQEIMPFHSPYMDGNVLPDTDWVTTIASGAYEHVPLLIGNTEYENKSFLPLYGPVVKALFDTPSPASAYGWFNLFFVLTSPPLMTLAAVLPTAADHDVYDKTGKYSSRMWKATYTDAIADAMMTESSSNSIYTYLFKWDGGGDSAVANFQFIYGAGHATDVPFWFGQYDVDTFGYSFTTVNRPGRVLLMNAMMDYLGTFVYTGDPNVSGLATWDLWTANGGGASGDAYLLNLNATTTALALGETSDPELTPGPSGSVAAEETTYEGGVAWGVLLANVLSIF